MGDFFYRPKNAWVGDVIPFFDNEEFKLFYLHDWRDKNRYGEGFPWYQVGTQDFINFKEYGEMISRGNENEQDLYVATGCVLKVERKYHIFYTGHNPYFPAKGKPQQGIMHAESSDLLNWEKIPEDTFYAGEDVYEQHDWRDPFVFWNKNTEEYWMLVAARLNKGPLRRRGCVALCKSKDLKKWNICEPFWAPNIYYTHECPDLFKIGDWYYLVYSSFSENFVTHYRISKTLEGPWIVPGVDSFDGTAYYAAKTCSNGEKRYIFGWNPTREQNKDYKNWDWGGNLVIHEIKQNPDNTLSVKVPDEINNVFQKDISYRFHPVLGDCLIGKEKVSIKAQSSFGYALADEMPLCCKISTKIKFFNNTTECGIMLRADDESGSGYFIKLEPKNNRLILDSWPRDAGIIFICKSITPYMAELERFVKLIPEKLYELKVFVDNTICEVYLNNQIAMSARIYNLKKGKWGIFVKEGEADFYSSKLFLPIGYL